MFRKLATTRDDYLITARANRRSLRTCLRSDVRDSRPSDSDWPDEDFNSHDTPAWDDTHWDVFIPDADELDPLPEPGDFWIEPVDLLESPATRAISAGLVPSRTSLR